ncbi:hypothetical protein [Antarctobacter sp.]|uniref:hypothetical protein n=1 Tax=Antarctobacter sp. TaxID=1872577 RepID=UPI002B27B5D3|nr:hypothetical protein [Antarctobacter sp.]
MKATLFTTAAVALLAVPAFAQDDMVGPDTDGDGLVSLVEAQAAYPDMSQDDFAQADTDGDGFLGTEEMEAAMAAGLIPAQDGG